MPKHRNCTDRHSGASFSPYRKPSVQASITTGAGISEQLTALQQLASQLAAKKRIIIISGAGISTNAGVPCFKNLSRTNMSSRNVFDLSAYSSLESANLLHQSELQILESAFRDEPQPFELFMEQLAQSGRLHRHYTQNIDCRTRKLPALSQRTIRLHGRLDRLRCHVYSQHTVPVQQLSLRELLGARCPICDEKNEERSREGKRLHSVGFLRPDVLLYNESDGADPQIMNAFEEDLRQNIDAVIIVGTTLHIPLLQDFTTKICRRMKCSRGKTHSPGTEGMVLWVSKEKPKVRAKLRDLIDSKFLQDCDEFAVQISPWLGNLKEISSTVIVSTEPDVGDERERQSQQSSTFDHPRPIRSIVDLTVDQEHCCLCPNVLGGGGELKSRVFVFNDYGCVLCGECVGKDSSLKLTCPKCDHFDSLYPHPQIVRQVFGLMCTICLESAGTDTTIERVCTPCGHAFCRACITAHLKNRHDDTSTNCPNCNTEISRDVGHFGRLQTVQRGLDIVEN